MRALLTSCRWQRRRRLVVCQIVTVSILALATGPAVAAQPPARAGATGVADPGVRPNRLIDRDEIRVSRVELEPGAVRSVHAHDDVEYHVWAPVEGSLEISINDGTAVAAQPGQAFFMTRGTRHGFRNTGTTRAAVFEIFVKKSTTNAGPAAPAPGAGGHRIVDLTQLLATVAPR